MNGKSWSEQILAFFRDEPLLALALCSALFAMATTPLAFAVLGRMQWFKARRGRVLQTPEFSSIVAAMMLVMTIPAIFSALVLKSRSFDADRYEFDPNRTWSVLEQGRGYADLKEADEAVRREMRRLAEERKNLVNGVKKLDESVLALRAVAGTSPSVAQTIPNLLERLASLRKSVGVDGPQQLMDFTAPPLQLASAVPAPTAPATTAPLAAPTPAPAPAAPTFGLPTAVAEAEVAAVPEPQRGIAAMLPLSDLPPGWEVGKSGDKFIETFNDENLFEKIDGRAESFVQYQVKGMAYTYYHPVGDESNEVQLYVFEMADSLRALGKYGSEKPDEAQPIPVGSEGYTTAGSTLFYAGPYYTQIVSTQDDPKFAAFALELAKRIAAKQSAPAAASVAGDAGETATATATAAAVTPEALFDLLPAGPGRSNPKYVAQDVFGYSFLSDVFMAEYTEGDVNWQGFLRPYASAEEAKAVFEKYVEGAKTDGAEIQEIQAEGADKMVVASNIGLIDAYFLKGNAVGGANGATQAPPAEAFARAFVKSLPDRLPFLNAGK
ncbi:MAG: DUF6599 family protein [Isosphaeraceae bacterium]